MKLTIFGATGGVGKQLVAQALEAGHQVTAYVRNAASLPAHPSLKVVQGELSDAAAVKRAIDGADAVLSAIGARQNTPDQPPLFRQAMENITQAMASAGVKRLVSIAGAGVLLPEDQVTFGRRFVRTLLGLVAKHVGQSKEEEVGVIRSSALDWVLVRPPRIVPGPRTGRYQVKGDRVPGSKISQGDVADLMLSCANGTQWLRQGPIPGY